MSAVDEFRRIYAAGQAPVCERDGCALLAVVIEPDDGDYLCFRHAIEAAWDEVVEWVAEVEEGSLAERFRPTEPWYAS